jgi:hypothetical protein
MRFVGRHAYRGRVILHGTIQQIPEPGAKSDTGVPLDDVQAEADTYDAAHEALTASVPAGWRLIAIRRD